MIIKIHLLIQLLVLVELSIRSAGLKTATSSVMTNNSKNNGHQGIRNSQIYLNDWFLVTLLLSTDDVISYN